MHAPTINYSDLFLFPKHFQHTVGHYKAAYYIECPQNNRDKAQHQSQIIIVLRLPHNYNGTNNNYSVNGVGTTHQRRMQYRGYPAYNFHAQKYRQYYDGDQVVMLHKEVHNLLHDYFRIDVKNVFDKL